MIKTKLENGIATICLDRPEKYNAFDDVMIDQLTQAFEEVENNNAARVMVLTSEGKHFSAGADLAWMQRMVNYNLEDNLRDARKLANMLNVLNTMSKPTIAKVQGAAFGGAVGLISACDIAIASVNASFCLSEVKIGLIPATISPYVIAAIGERAARRYFLSAERFSVVNALRLGLISDACKVEELDSKVTTLCQNLLLNSPQAMRYSKALIRDVVNTPLNDDLIEETSQRIAMIRTSAEGQEGLNAFLEKRQPNWGLSHTSPKSET